MKHEWVWIATGCTEQQQKKTQHDEERNPTMTSKSYTPHNSCIKFHFSHFPLRWLAQTNKKYQQTSEWVAKKSAFALRAGSWWFCMCTTFNYLRLLTTWDAKEEKTIEWLFFHLIYHKSERRPSASDERDAEDGEGRKKKVPDISIVKFLSFPLPDSAVHPSSSWFCSLLDERHHPFDTFDPFLLAPFVVFSSEPYSFIIVLEWCSSCAS